MSVRILTGNATDKLAELPAGSVHCCVTSPPYYGLRDYGVAGQIGLEPSPNEYVAALVAVFRDVRRVLRVDGTLWLNIGDSYGSGEIGRHDVSPEALARRAVMYGTGIGDGSVVNERRQQMRPRTGVKPKDLIGIPWMLAFALRADGWWLRQDIIWSKPNPMPESVTDRCTKAHEYVFLLSKNERYYYDADAIKENGALKKSGNTEHKYVNGEKLHRTKSGFLKMHQNIYEKVNKRSVWEITPAPFGEAHFATFPPALVKPCILAGCPEGGTVLDPFSGAGTTGLVADQLGRDATLIEINPEYVEIARRRIERDAPLFSEVLVKQEMSEERTSR